MISILILTKNEELDLPGCLESLSWSDDIHVYDSFSSDRTVEIAEAAGATVTQRNFDNWASHQNWGLQNIAFKYPWVYYSDADERTTIEQVREMQEAVKDPGKHVAFRMRRRDYFMGKWLKHVVPSPFNIRLFRPEKIRYERMVNPVSKVDGPVGDLEAHFDHYPFSKGISHWIAKHNSYSTLEAQQIMHNRRDHLEWSVKEAFFAKDKNMRRFHQKELFYSFPARPLIKFILFYFVRRGFLDGYPGLTYALLQSVYEYMIVLKTRELEVIEDSNQ